MVGLGVVAALLVRHDPAAAGVIDLVVHLRDVLLDAFQALLEFDNALAKAAADLGQALAEDEQAEGADDDPLGEAGHSEGEHVRCHKNPSTERTRGFAESAKTIAKQSPLIIDHFRRNVKPT